MKKVKIKFVDYWENHHIEKDPIFNILCKFYDVQICDDPDYIFCSVFSDEHFNYDCIKILYTAENIVPDFNLYDYGIGFEYLTCEDRYIRFPNFIKYDDVESALRKHIIVDTEQDDLLDRRFCSFVYSNGYAHSKRQEIFDELQKYRAIDSGGGFLNNIGECVKDKVKFESLHKFSIACENCSHVGYSTEKILQAFAAQTIPIYWGDPVVERIFNKKAFINVNEYSSMDELIKKVQEIDGDDGKYLAMLKEPAFVNQDYALNKRNELEHFILNIFNQPYEMAFRRCLEMRGKLYNDKLKMWKGTFEKTQKKRLKGIRKYFM